jgi:ribonuclease-3
MAGRRKNCQCNRNFQEKAEEKAAQRAFYILNKKENILGNSKTL